MKKVLLLTIGLSLSTMLFGQSPSNPISAPALTDVSRLLNGKSNDFGMSFNLGIEKKIRPGLSVELEGEMRTQDNTRQTERWTIGARVNYRLYQTLDRRFSLKTGLGFEYMWLHRMNETTAFHKVAEHYTTVMNEEGVDEEMINGYNERMGNKYTSMYWRNRHRTSLSFTGTYSPSKRWSFSLRETFQYAHYCSTDSIPRMRYNTTYHKWRETGDFDADGQPLYYDANQWGINGDGDEYLNPDAVAVPFMDENNKSPRKSKDRVVLRSKFTVKYNVKGIPLEPYVSIDYGAGLNYTANKWKFLVGTEYRINKIHELNLFYRFSHEDDDDEPNGHMLGVGYKFNF